jgi:predicted Zn-dependent peptidase
MRKTRFDKIMEELEKQGKVSKVDPEERELIMTGLRNALLEHNSSEKIRQHLSKIYMENIPKIT